MTCTSCNGRGIFKLFSYDDNGPTGDPVEWAICLCAAGSPYRVQSNNGKAHLPHYQLWAIRHGIDPERVAPMEVLYTDEELAARGFGQVSAPTAIEAIAAAARHR